MVLLQALFTLCILIYGGVRLSRHACFINTSADLPRNRSIQQHCRDGSDNGTNQRNNGITPLGAALSLDGQKSVCQTGTDITGRVNGIAGKAAQGHTDGYDDTEHQELLQPGGKTGNIGDSLNSKYQYEGTNGLA